MIYQSNASPTPTTSGSSQRPEVAPAQHQSAASSGASRATNDNRATSNQANVQQQTSSTGSAAAATAAAANQLQHQEQSCQLPAHLLRQQRPIRPNLRRQVVIAARDVHHQASVPIGAHHIELATVLPARAKIIPPQRPAHLPARYDGTFGRVGGAVGVVDPAPSHADKPNRYAAWAQQHRWHAHQWPPLDQQSVAAGGGELDEQGQQHHGFQHHFASPLSSAASRVLVVNPMQIVNLSEHTKSKLIKFIEAVKRFSEKWFSHVLLLMFLAVYACFGAYIFISFEAPTEQWEKQLIIETKLRVINESWQDAHDKSREDFLDSYKSKFEEYERLLNRVCASGMTSSSLENQWTFWGALFYSMTVFTTIGYGHLTPITFAGRVATMVYAIFGIPILLMVLADLGKLLTRIIKFSFKKFRYLYNKLLGRKASIRTRKLISDNTSQYISVARDAFERGFAHIQPYNKIPMAFRNASFRSPAGSRPKTDKLIISEEGDNCQPQEQAQEPQQPQVDKKLSVTTDVIVTPGKQTKPVSPLADEKSKSLADHQANQTSQGQASASNQQQRSQSSAKPKQQRKTSSGSKPKQLADQQIKQQAATADAAKALHSSTSNTEKGIPIGGVSCDKSNEMPSAETRASSQVAKADELEPKDPELKLDYGAEGEANEMDEDEDLDEDDFDIPVSFALFLLVTYMMFGAVVFSIWEGWNFFDALYFVFISMSTIGFGDLVPQHPKRMIGTFIYLLLGLALTSMCINVVQEKIHATFLRAKMQIGEKMGLDLDQIMADDYYDGPIGLDGAGTIGGGNGDDDDAYSVAFSQTNSCTHVGAGETCDQETTGDAAHRRPNKLASSLDSGQGHQPEVGVKGSRSRESLKVKRRQGAGLGDGLGGIYGGGVGGGGGASGGSLKRKPSRKVSRNQSQSQPQAQQPVPASGADPPPTEAQQCQQPAPTTSLPLAAELEVCKAEQQSAVASELTPGLNFPVNNVGGFCEPLEVVKVDSLGSSNQQRPKLMSTRSQPTAMTKSLSSETNRLDRSPKSQAASGGDGGAGEMVANHRANTISRSHKSEGSSRRASVSDELNQLDDLIKVLSRTPSERFGPLLGIPSSSRSSRSGSPNSSLASRRGTSMTIRRPNTTSPRPVIQKKRSLVIAGPHHSMNNFDQLKTLSNSGVASESQVALDELESVKYSAV